MTGIAKTLRVIEADLKNSEHQKTVLNMVREFSRSVGGQDLHEDSQERLIEGLRQHPAIHVFIAFDKRHPIGFAICFLGFSTFAARSLLNIHDFYVRDGYRRRGVGGRILQAIEEKAHSLDCCKLTLEVETNNHPALSLYDRFGFEEVLYDAGAGTVLFRQKILRNPGQESCS